MASNALELAALAQRGFLVPFNEYNSASQGNGYSEQHPNSMSDGDNKGKGTGLYLDTANGGSDLDINGSPLYLGSGRVALLASNQYDQANFYDHPDTSGNVGQVVI